MMLYTSVLTLLAAAQLSLATPVPQIDNAPVIFDIEFFASPTCSAVSKTGGDSFSIGEFTDDSTIGQCTTVSVNGEDDVGGGTTARIGGQGEAAANCGVILYSDDHCTAQPVSLAPDACTYTGYAIRSYLLVNCNIL